MTATLYSETNSPRCDPLTLVRRYGISIDELANGKIFLSFGYGFSGPSKPSEAWGPYNNFISHTTLLSDIDPSSVVTGDASLQDNLSRFGGWCVQYGWGQAYNATPVGPYVEFVEVTEDGNKRRRYRIVTEHPELVASWLRGEEVGDDRYSISATAGSHQ